MLIVRETQAMRDANKARLAAAQRNSSISLSGHRRAFYQFDIRLITGTHITEWKTLDDPPDICDWARDYYRDCGGSATIAAVLGLTGDWWNDETIYVAWICISKPDGTCVVLSQEYLHELT